MTKDTKSPKPAEAPVAGDAADSADRAGKARTTVKKPPTAKKAATPAKPRARKTESLKAVPAKAETGPKDASPKEAASSAEPKAAPAPKQSAPKASATRSRSVKSAPAKPATARKAPAKPTEEVGSEAADKPVNEPTAVVQKSADSADKAKKPPRARGRTKSADKPQPEVASTGPDATTVREPLAEDTPKPRTQKPREPHVEKAGESLGISATSVEDGASASTVEAAPGDAPARSRRSRRGGRRRNRNRNNGSANGEQAVQSAENASAAETVVEETADADVPSQAAGGSAKIGEGDSSRGSRAKSGGSSRSSRAKQSGSQATTTESVEAKPAKARSTDAKAEGKDAQPEGKTPGARPAKGAKRSMFVSVLSGELVEVVLAEQGQISEYYVEMKHQAKVKGNIYKGVVSNVDANLQAAFVSYAGGVKNGFLQIDEVHPEYYTSHQDAAKGRKYPLIQKVLKPGQEILVQVVKEPAGTKGAFLTTYLSLPGRFLVLTPGREQIGVSRKVDSDEERTRLKGMLEGLNPGPGLGVIVRTVSEGASKTSLQRDLQFLKRLWKEVRAKGQTSPAPGLIYQELDLSTRAVRDYLTDDVQEVWVDDEQTASQVTEMAALLFPKKKGLVQVHVDHGQTLFERFSLQKQLDQVHSREVSLPSGGRLAIDIAEALTAIDINSGRSSGKNNFEDMAYRTNLEAAKAIPLQLRLRDIGGQIVVDFIEMRDRNHWREVEKAVLTGMKGDRARYDVGKIGPFGLLEIVRQRLGSSAISVSTEPCPCCKGTGMRRNMEWQSVQSLREIGKLLRQAAAGKQATVTYEAEPELAIYLLNSKRDVIHTMEKAAGAAVVIKPAIR